MGDRVYNREDTLRRIAAEGHTVGVHSTTHTYKEIYASAEAFMKDVVGCEQIIERVTGIKPTVYRFPGGGKHAQYAELLRERGYTVVGWNAVCGDEEIPHADTETLTATAISTAKGKSRMVMLLHDSAPHKATAEALRDIIAHFRADDGILFSC